MPSKKQQHKRSPLPPAPPALEPVSILHLESKPQLDRVSWNLYDSFLLRGRPVEINKLGLFARYPRSLAETNMLCPGFLPQPQRFTTHRVVFEFLNMPWKTDVRHFLRLATFRFIVGNKSYLDGMLRDLMSPDLNRLREPVEIEAMQHFEFVVELAEPLFLDEDGPGIRGRVILNGMLARPRA